MKPTTLLSVSAVLAAPFINPAAAQEKESCEPVKTNWSVCIDEEAENKACWGVSAPESTVNTREGRVVAARRGDILLFVSFRPQDSVAGEVSFTGGYPFADGSTVTLEVGGATYELFTEGEWAWPATAGDDVKIVTSMKRGTEAVLTGRSTRGTLTKDTFSLLGFTAAFDEAEARCTG